MSARQPEASTSMSTSASATADLPRDARIIALILASKGIEDATPQVIHQLLEFAHRYATDILMGAMSYSEHAGKAGKLDMEDVELAVQETVNWGFKQAGEREYLMPLAQEINSHPLPIVPESSFIRLPHPRHLLTAPNFNLVPNKPPAGYGSPSSPTSSHSGFSDDESDHLPSPEPDELPKDIDSAGGGDDDDDMNEDEMMMEPVTLAPVAPNGSGIGEKRRLEDDDEEDYDV